MIKLEKIIGLTSLSNASLVSTRANSDTFYAAGNCVVRYNVDDNSQKSFYRASNTVACLAVSLDGKYLAAGESGPNPNIFVWNVSSGAQHSIHSGHKHGIGCIAFSPDSQYLVSAGFKHDKQLILWDWEAQRKLSVQKLGNKVNSMCFNYDGSFFVTCGDRHLKWWYLTCSKVADGSMEVTGKAASILEAHKDAVFMDIKIGIDNYVYCATSTGLLCAFNETRFMKMWVQLEARVSYSVALLENGGADISRNMIIVGCSEGCMSAFSAKTLNHITTLPLPEPSMGSFSKPGAVLAMCIVPANKRKDKEKITSDIVTQKLVVVYGDRSLFIWNITDIDDVFHHRSFFYHSACIWDVQFICPSLHEDSVFPRGTFVTCSADSTIRLWNDNPVLQKSPPRRASTGAVSDQAPRDMIHMLYISPNATSSEGSSQHISDQSTSSTSSLTRTIADVATGLTRSLTNPRSGIPDLEIPDRPQIRSAPRALAVHPSGRQLTCGDRSGLLRVFDLATMEQKHSTQAHTAELLTLHYSPYISAPGGSKEEFDDGISRRGLDVGKAEGAGSESTDPIVLLASAGRDRLVHVFNASNEYRLVSTLDNHKSPVTAVKFTSDGKKLLSCSADKTMAFSAVSGTDIELLRTVQTPHGTINGLAIDASNRFAVASGQNCRLSIWNLQSGKNVRTYKTEAVKGELYKSDIDPSGMYIATCAFDRTLSIFDFFSGDLIARVSGHSELITAVRFSPDGRYLLSVGGDGCIMRWSLADSLVQGIQDRIMELATDNNLKSAQSPLPSPVPSAELACLSSLSNDAPLPTPPSRDNRFSPPPPPPPSLPMERGKIKAGGMGRAVTRDIARSRFSTSPPRKAASMPSGNRGGNNKYDTAGETDYEDDEVKRNYADEVNSDGSMTEDEGVGEGGMEEDGEGEGDERGRQRASRNPTNRSESSNVEDTESNRDRDDAHERASRHLDGLESWLEDLLKAETTEPSVEEGSRKGDILATSLSSKFFENLKRSGSSKDSVSRRSSLSGGPKERERERDVHEAMEGEVEEDEEESVAALKARLRSIGVLGEPAVAGDKLYPLSPSIQRKIDSRAAVNSDDGVYRARRARHKELYLEQEEQLRIKAAHCKEVVRELNRAQEAAAASFKDLAKLRASVDETIAISNKTREDIMSNSPDQGHREVPWRDGTGVSDLSDDPLGCSQVILETDALMQEYRRISLGPNGASRAGSSRRSEPR